MKRKKDSIKKRMNKIVYWSALLITIVGNLIISAALIPFLIVLRNIELYGIIVVLGIAFGLLFNLLLEDIEHIDIKHHIIAAIFIPGIAIVNVFIITNLSNKIINVLQVTNIEHNPYGVSIIYVLAFILPYAISRIIK